MQFDDKTQWSSELLKAQEHYLDAVNQYFTSLQQHSHPDRESWGPFFEQLNQAAASAFSREDFPVFNNLLLQSNKINSFYRGFGDFFQSLNQGNSSAIDINSAVNQFCDYIEQQGQQFNKGFGIESGFPSSANLLQSYWHEFVHSACSNDLDQHFEQQLMDVLKNNTGNGLVKEELTELLDLWRAYIQAFNEYELNLAEVNKLAVQKSRYALSELLSSGEKIESIKTLYYLWIDCHDQAYRDIVFTDEHAKVFAGIINSFMRLRKKLMEVSKETALLLNVADKVDLEEVIEKQKSLESELQQSKEELSANRLKIDELTRELDELKNLIQGQTNEQTNDEGQN